MGKIRDSVRERKQQKRKQEKVERLKSSLQNDFKDILNHGSLRDLKFLKKVFKNRNDLKSLIRMLDI